MRLVYDSFVPLYFVVPTAPIDDYYASCPVNFLGRQELFENMFRVTRSEEVIVEGFPPVEVYVGFYAFYLSWLLYPPIADHATPPDCRQYNYSL